MSKRKRPDEAKRRESAKHLAYELKMLTNCRELLSRERYCQELWIGLA